MTVGFQWIPRGWSPGTLRFGELEKVLPQNTPTKSITACSVGYIMLWMISTLLHFFRKNLYWFFGGGWVFCLLVFLGKDRRVNPGFKSFFPPIWNWNGPLLLHVCEREER